jgi:hypothetical protein
LSKRKIQLSDKARGRALYDFPREEEKSSTWATLHLTYPSPHIEGKRADERLGAQQQIRLVDFSVFNTAPRRSLMALLKGYMDDSHNGPIWSVGGYVGSQDDWQKFNKLWRDVLHKHHVPYFHMKEMGKEKGAYKHWYPRQEHQVEIDEFFKDITEVIHESDLFGVCSIVRADDIERFNKDYRQKLEPFPLAAYGCLIAVSWLFRNNIIEIIFDHCDKINSKLFKARKLADNDAEWAAFVARNVMCMPLADRLTFRNVLEIQSADYLAWELRKEHLKIQDWYYLPGKPDALVDRQEHFERWATQNNIPPPRKSLNALLAPGKIFPQVWTYEDLVHENAVRNGKWF